MRQLVVGDSVMNSYAYTAWGVPLHWHERILNRYTFTSREYNPETTLYHYRLRGYSAELAVFMSYDLATMFPSYKYCDNDPVNFLDPTGEVPTWSEVKGEEDVFVAGKQVFRSDLIQLAKDVGGTKEDWKCIWIVCLPEKKKARYMGDNVRLPKGTKVSVSNIKATSGKTLFLTYQADKWQFFKPVVGQKGEFVMIPATSGEQSFYRKLADVSGEGATPISLLYLGGHCRLWWTKLKGEADREKQLVIFSLLGIKRYAKKLDKHETLKRRMEKKGPLWCWFTRTAKVYFVGCTTKGIARAAARHKTYRIFRKGVTVYGTRGYLRWIRASKGGSVIGVRFRKIRGRGFLTPLIRDPSKVFEAPAKSTKKGGTIWGVFVAP